MKKLYLSLIGCALMMSMATAAQAQTIRRVNNTGVTGANVYTTAQAAHDAAAPGDIIQLDPSSADYGGLTCSKNVKVVGPGYFLDRNPGLQTLTASARLANVVFTLTSAGASMAGVTIIGQSELGASGLVFERNYAVGGITIGNRTASTTNTTVRQNFAESVTLTGANAQNISRTDVYVANNIIRQGVYLQSGAFDAVTGVFVNNTSLASSYFEEFNVQNNYFGSAVTTTGGVVSYNVGARADLGTGNNNQINVPITAVFLPPVGGEYDGQWQLKGGTNPARGAGTGGTDVGAFGGTNPYKLSGIPAIPSIYEYNQTLNGAQLQVTLSTRANN